MTDRTKNAIKDLTIVAAATALAFAISGCTAIARHVPGISIGIHHDGGTDLNIGLQLSAPPAETQTTPPEEPHPEEKPQ
jgi:hypothetical protein